MYVQKAYNVYYALILLLVAVFLAKLGWSVYQKGGMDGVREAFQTYKVKPFDYMKTGKDPLHFYRRDRFRKPYRWPLKFYKSYPTPHYSFLE
jgi:hypothetical protein